MTALNHPRRSSLTHSLMTFLVLATCLRIWLGPITTVESANAQIPDSGLQRKELIEEARQTNQLLSEIKELLAKGTLNVRIQGADNKGADNK